VDDPQRFATTRWSVVLAAGDGAVPALEDLCRAYWYPLYAFARRRGWQPEDAKDLVQGFFARLLERDLLGAVDPERGRFRSFLLTCFRNFMINEAERAAAGKRGGDRVVLSLDHDDPEARFALEPSHGATPERIFERDWALALLASVLADLRAGYRERGKENQFDALKEYLAQPGSGSSYAETARTLEMTEGALRVAVHRMRQRYRAALRTAVADTVSEPPEVEEELASLFRALTPL